MTSWRHPRFLLDGGMGTELMAQGLDPAADCAESWNRSHPDIVQRVYSAYFDAGADAVQTNTFGGTRLRLAAHSKHTEVRALNVVGALLAREVRPPGRIIIGSIGPTGAIPPPQGMADLAEMEDAFAEQAAALAEGGVDLLHIETMYHAKEARAALRGVRQGAPGLAVVASMTCKLTTGGYATPLGFGPEVMLATFLEEQVDGVGANCTLSPAGMLDLVRLMRARTPLPIFAKPTATPGAAEHVMPGDMATGALALLAAGATAVGGCCGATPADIAAIRLALSKPSTLQDLDL
jgi:5-methyltetrahydrofolate--homocysteine methyltransferase